ncbi:hypothetical protein BN946_scf184990.g1, partial [Trametes cinnabarina]
LSQQMNPLMRAPRSQLAARRFHQHHLIQTHLRPTPSPLPPHATERLLAGKGGRLHRPLSPKIWKWLPPRPMLRRLRHQTRGAPALHVVAAWALARQTGSR